MPQLLLVEQQTYSVLFTKPRVKLCAHSTFAFAFASTSPSKFNIASMETQTQKHRMGLIPFLTFYIDVVANANAKLKCEHSFIQTHVSSLKPGRLQLHVCM